MKREKKYDTYIHTILNVYNDKLMKYSPVIRKDGSTKREEMFNKMKKDIEREFEIYDGAFLLIKIESDLYKQKETIRIAWNCFNVYFKHNGYNSCADVLVRDVFDLQEFSLGMNCKIIKEYDKKEFFINVIRDYYKR